LHWHTSSLLLRTMSGGGGMLFSFKSCFWMNTYVSVLVQWCS
jgi:hypothetical protein